MVFNELFLSVALESIIHQIREKPQYLVVSRLELLPGFVRSAKIASGIANADRERLGAIAASRVSVTISMPVGSVKKGHPRGFSLFGDVRKWSC